jgi:hypothetical protein
LAVYRENFIHHETLVEVKISPLTKSIAPKVPSDAASKDSVNIDSCTVGDD